MFLDWMFTVKITVKIKPNCKDGSINNWITQNKSHLRSKVLAAYWRQHLLFKADRLSYNLVDRTETI